MLKKIKSLLFKSIFKSEADKISRESEMRTLGKCSEQMNMLRKENTKLLLSLNESEETYLQVKEESERIKKRQKELEENIKNSIWNQISAILLDHDIKNLESKYNYYIEESNGEWRLYTGICQMGGCYISPIGFDSQIGAVKYGAIRDVLGIELERGLCQECRIDYYEMIA